jgi:hypothetical protein
MENDIKEPIVEKHNEENSSKEEPILSRKNIYLFAVIILLLLGGLAFSYQKKAIVKKETTIKENTEKFIKENLIQPGTDFEITEFVKEGSLYKLVASVSGQNITAYVSEDGKKFFPSAIDLDKNAEKDSPANANPAAAEAQQKQDVPGVELFVMSYCPYGTQIEKGILPVISALGNKIKFSLKFVDYAMHGKKEIDENSRQYCIQKEQSAKLNSYLTCFLKKGEGTEQACMKTTGVNAAQVVACMSAADKQFKLTEKFNDKNTWSNGTYPPFDVNKDDAVKYGVKGSPTLVVNGETLGAGRDSASLLKAVCSGFKTAPKECNQTLSATAPAAGFGEGAAPANAASDAAACGTPATQN